MPVTFVIMVAVDREGDTTDSITDPLITIEVSAISTLEVACTVGVTYSKV